MARQLRIEYEGAFYHVTSRGNEKKNIFIDDQDRRQFLKYAQQQILHYNIKIHVWCLMNNHYHLVIETPWGNLSRAMQTLNTSYTVYFNHKHKRAGHLFQGRYKAILVQADEYLHYLSKYIHLNPVRAKLVKNPEEYKWSSYRDYTGQDYDKKFLTTEFILGMFNNNIEKARRLYKEFIKVDIGKEPRIIRDNIRKGFILGKQDFVNWVKSRFLVERENKEIPTLKQFKERITIEEIEAEVKKRVKGEKLQKKICIYLTRKYTNQKLEEIANHFGEISYSGISKIYWRLEKKRDEDKELDLLISEIEKASNVQI